MTRENLDFVNNNGEKVLKLDDDIFRNIYPPQMVEFYDNVEHKNNKIILKYSSKTFVTPISKTVDILDNLPNFKR